MFRAPPAALAAALCIATSLLLPGSLAAQAEFAVPVGRGMLRVNFTPDWLSYDHRFGLNVPGYANGAPVPINVDFFAESLGVASLPLLKPLQDQVRAASGLSGFNLNLGRNVVQLNASVRTLPIGLELGLTRRLSIGVTVPIVRSRVDVSVIVDTAAAKQGNAGWNPGFLDSTSVAGFKAQLASVLTALQAQATSGPPALRPKAQALLTALRPYQPLTTAPLLPRSSSAAGDSLTVRLDSAETSYAQLLIQYAAQGVAMPSLTAKLALPDSALTRAGLERFFSDPSLPLSADTLGTVVTTRLGDITAQATYQFAEGALYRGQLLVTTRLPTGTPPSAKNFLDLGTGTHQWGLELGLANDLMLGRNFLFHVVARSGKGFADKLSRRVTTPDLPMAPLSQLATVNRKPGSYVALDVQPVWVLDDAFSVRFAYSYLNQAQTHYSYVTAADSLRVGLPASVLDQETDQRLMRIGGGVTFSTLSRYVAGNASLPYSVTVSYENTIWGRGGRVPQASIFRIQIRGYVRLFN
jgi:hypothetical protein